MAAHFNEAGVTFLRGLAKHNNRDWYEARRAVYEREIRDPMLAAITEINSSMASFAPEHVRPPGKIMLRFYRDIRFSKSKLPYKTQVAAWWARRGMNKTSGSGFYLQFGPDGVRVAGGAFMPEKDQLLAIRRHLVEHHAHYRKLLLKGKRRGLMTEVDPFAMTRGPKGFENAAEAMDLVLQRKWGLGTTLPVEQGLAPTLVETVLEHMKITLPLVAFLNEPLVRKTERKPLF